MGREEKWRAFKKAPQDSALCICPCYPAAASCQKQRVLRDNQSVGLLRVLLRTECGCCQLVSRGRPQTCHGTTSVTPWQGLLPGTTPEVCPGNYSIIFLCRLLSADAGFIPGLREGGAGVCVFPLRSQSTRCEGSWHQLADLACCGMRMENSSSNEEAHSPTSQAPACRVRKLCPVSGASLPPLGVGGGEGNETPIWALFSLSQMTRKRRRARLERCCL